MSERPTYKVSFIIEEIVETETQELAKTGDAMKRLLLAEWTLCAKNEASSATIADLTTS